MCRCKMNQYRRLNIHFKGENGMKKVSKTFAVLLAVMVAMTAFAGCGSKTQESVTTEEGTKTTTETAEPAEPVNIRIATMFGGTDPATEVYKKAIEDYMAANPNVKIVDESMTSIGDEYRTKIKTDYAAGNEPEIIFFYTAADAKPLIENNKVMAYDEIWKTYPEVGKDITDGIKESMREFDGKIYALPVTGFYEGLFVNKEIFEANGLELPTDWAKLEEAVEVLSAKGIVPIAGPLGQSHYLIEHFVLSAAGEEGHNDVFANGVNPDWYTAFNNIKAFYEKKAFSEDAINMDIEGSQMLFKNEKAAMILEGSWFIGGCDPALQEKMTVIPMPSFTNGKKDPTSIVAGFSFGYYISTKGYNDESKRDIIIDLVSYLTTADMIAKMAEANGGTPAASVKVPGLSSVASAGHAMVAAAKALNMPIDSRLTPEAFNYIVKQGTPYIAAGKSTPEAVLEEVRKIHLGE
ncbi:MAG: raffinose/stachyose/melibiose transport system substrate-binding protein [Epulopiscium sp.]|nr:raffinose/stachyose/melibiose transport system substrate-binding protein [Candidatus Epulonipiscium sp.]